MLQRNTGPLRRLFRLMTKAMSSGKQGGRKRKAGSLTSEDASPEKASVSFNKVVSYSTNERCRRAMLLEHFGERLTSACQGCDYCLEPQKVSMQVKGPVRVRFCNSQEQSLALEYSRVCQAWSTAPVPKYVLQTQQWPRSRQQS